MSHSPIPYVLGRRIGMGTYAEVFHATSRADGSVVAYKRAKEGDPAAVKRLRREVKVQGLLDHPNVMPVLDSDLERAWFTLASQAGCQVVLSIPSLRGESMRRAEPTKSSASAETPSDGR